MPLQGGEHLRLALAFGRSILVVHLGDVGGNGALSAVQSTPAASSAGMWGCPVLAGQTWKVFSGVRQRSVRYGVQVLW